MGLILDTSALIVWERAQAKGERVDMSPDELISIPAIVWAEALIGVRLAATPRQAAQRRARLEALRSVTQLIPFTPDIAEHYADIYSELSCAGTPIPQNDMAVAATARSMGYGVLVGASDEQHYRCVQGLHVHVLTFVA
ncbi:MAG TPA: type II toxin-antitoxin system VapC family toxin [Kiritimatiellia bacterium]|nr:type II toxin-antitoxin system VapC family toxin [Kiritimatiellia bacterium]HMP00249.1 type II toxin-antitoxin system VapC family toxin [Kiritimatiellia bacterium]